MSTTEGALSTTEGALLWFSEKATKQSRILGADFAADGSCTTVEGFSKDGMIYITAITDHPPGDSPWKK